jgi:hypothetical protein
MANESIVSRMIRAARLDKAFYHEVEADTSLNNQALLVVIIGALASGVGALLGGAYSFFWGAGFGPAIINMVVSILVVVIGYFLWVYVTRYVATRFFGGTGDAGELRRTLGYAMTPQVLNILVFIPCLGVISLIAWIWTLAAGFIAVREGMELENTKALMTVVIGWMIILAIRVILGTILNIGAFIF